MKNIRLGLPLLVLAVLGTALQAAGPANVTSNAAAGSSKTVDARGIADNAAPWVSGVSASNVVDANHGQTAYDFTVTYAGDMAIQVVTLGDADIYVTTPSAGTLGATFISVTPSGDGTPRTATYRIVPPGGTWDVADNGTYTIGIYVDQVADLSWAYVPANPNLGTFTATLVNRIPQITEGGTAPVTSDEENSPTPFVLTLHATDEDGHALTWSVPTLPNHGSASASTPGLSSTISYTPAAHYNGGDSFVVQVSDGNGGTDTITVDVTVNPINDAPVNTVPGSQTVDEDTDLVFSTGTGNGLTVADLDVAETTDGKLMITLAVSHGRLTLAQTTGLIFSVGDGTADPTMTFNALPAALNAAMNGMVYRGDLDYYGSDTLGVTTSDQGNTGSGGALIDSDAVGITVNSVNDAPVVSGFSASAVVDADYQETSYDFTVTYSDDTAVAVNTLGNADIYVTTPSAGTLAASFISVTPEDNGTPRTATYRIVPPGGDWDVADNGTYTIGIYVDQVGDESWVWVAANPNIGTFTVTIVNVAPVITEGATVSRTIDEDNSPVAFALTLHATDGDGDTLAWSIQTQPLHGSASAATPGLSSVVSYTPAASYNGGDSFVVQVSDGSGGTDTITVDVTINPINDAPVNTVPGSQTVDEDTNLGFGTGTGNGITVADVDVAETTNGKLMITLAVDHGRLTLAQTTGLTFSVGDGTADPTMTFNALPAALNAAMNGMVYRGDLDYYGSDTLGVTTSDQGNTGSGGALIDSDAVGITVNSVNDAPVVSGVSAPDVGDADDGETIYEFTVTYSDDAAIDIATIGAGDVYVTTPSAGTIPASFISAAPSGNGTPRTATYRIVPPDGSWDVSDNGTYAIGINASQVADEIGVYVAANPSIGTFTAALEINYFTLTYTPNPHGTITGVTPQSVALGGSGTEVIATPDPGYHFTSWSDGILTAARTDTNITGNISVSASFAINTYTLIYSAGAGGTITGATPQSVDHGGSGTQVTAVPNTGYHFTSWSDSVPTASRTDANVTGNIDVTANFAVNDQRSALIAFYNSTGGAGWTNQTNWKAEPLEADGFGPNGTEGTWYGVTMVGGVVTRLELADNNLTGTLPAVVLGALPGLDWLDLSHNHLGNPLPPEIVSLSSLRGLLLSYNNLSGFIPTFLGGLTNLTDLRLDGNAFSGPIPTELGSLTNLLSLWLGNNDLEDPIPPSLGNLTKLEYLHLGHNALEGPIPDELAAMKDLITLNLGDNALTGPIPTWLGGTGGITGLVQIYLQTNNLDGAIPPELAGLTSLSELWIYDNDLTGQIPAALGSLSALAVLYLDHNHLTGTIPEQLGSLLNLASFGCKGNMLIGPLPLTLKNLVNLEPFDGSFSYNSLYTDDAELAAFITAIDSTWQNYQTVAPTGVTATPLDSAAIRISWTPILFTNHAGGYKVFRSSTPGEGYSLEGQTADLTLSSYDVSGLTPGQRYYFVVQSHTDAHALNKNAVDSENSAEVSAVASLTATVRIQGTVLVGTTPLSGVQMAGLPGNPVTNASGVYDVTVLAGLSWTVTPTLAGYSFSPVSRSYSDLVENRLGQDYTATVVTPELAVTSPNGGESWAAGSAHDITWTQLGLTGTVTVDLYKGGAWQKTLGTPEATAGTFSWTIASIETAGTDYMIRIWQSGGVSDDSDTNFALVRKVKVDFNKDGQEDILWRYHGGGDFQGWNVAWLMHQDGETLPLISGVSQQQELGATMALTRQPQVDSFVTPIDPANSPAPESVRLYGNPMDSRIPQRPEKMVSYRTPMEVDNLKAQRPTRFKLDPIEYSGKSVRTDNVRTKENNLGVLSATQTAERASAAGGSGGMETASIKPSDFMYLGIVPDTTWEIAGTGDFNGDGNTGILWRNYGSGEFQGWNVIWYMDGETITDFGYLGAVLDTDWKIVGTGDFDKDGRIDILWRNYGSGEFSGWNVIWYMNGVTITHFGYLGPVLDTAWKIAGTGDFDRDGNADILWRYHGSGQFLGWNVIWYMEGETITSFGLGWLSRVEDLAWEIAGIGDFDGDGNTDLLWRYYGSGQFLGWNVIWYMEGETITSFDYLRIIEDLNWRIVNH